MTPNGDAGAGCVPPAFRGNMATSTINQRGYDPHAMAFRTQALNDAVARRSQANAKKGASDASPTSATPAEKTQPPASRADGRKGKLITKRKRRPFPKPNPNDYVIVVKPHSVRWRSGTIVEVRKFRTSNKARVTFAGQKKPRFFHYDTMLIPVQPYYRRIPACGNCGVVGHRIDACLNPRPNTCGLCGQQVQLVEEGLRALMIVYHAHNQLTSMHSQVPHSQSGHPKGKKSRMAAKKRRQLLPHDEAGEPPRRDNAKKEKQAPLPKQSGSSRRCSPAETLTWCGDLPESLAGRRPAARFFGCNVVTVDLDARSFLRYCRRTAPALHWAPVACTLPSLRLPPPSWSYSSGLGLAAGPGAPGGRTEAAIGKMTEAIPTLMAQVARSNKRIGLIKDVSGRCSLAGMEDSPHVASAGSGAPPSQSLVNLTDHGGHP
ncbi:hypothetical protein HPB48_001977 [Haemaphysalis longicornis]|uniref:Uncharacterized protein n=1 Tax=Haemaphysalis longicornis TaxID=44386 RepID=A0A9J6GG79_HAELO|nr:hypothetical protein HPB48_001977 [Haemaphysalis longicornis]